MAGSSAQINNKESLFPEGAVISDLLQINKSQISDWSGLLLVLMCRDSINSMDSMNSTMETYV